MSRYEVRGVDTYELRNGAVPERAYYPIATFDVEAEALACAEARALEPYQKDPNLCDRIEIFDGAEGRVIWSKVRPSD